MNIKLGDRCLNIHKGPIHLNKRGCIDAYSNTYVILVKPRLHLSHRKIDYKHYIKSCRNYTHCCLLHLRSETLIFKQSKNINMSEKARIGGRIKKKRKKGKKEKEKEKECNSSLKKSYIASSKACLPTYIYDKKWKWHKHSSAVFLWVWPHRYLGFESTHVSQAKCELRSRINGPFWT